MFDITKIDANFCYETTVLKDVPVFTCLYILSYRGFIIKHYFE
jgi:hypothetical protein